MSARKKTSNDMRLSLPGAQKVVVEAAALAEEVAEWDAGRVQLVSTTVPIAMEVEVLAEERPTLAATIGREVRVLVGVCFIRLRPMHYAVV